MLRIIAGSHKGRRLFAPKNKTIRPTTDRLRESIFNILSHQVKDAWVLDLFAGTGALALEALSRGARYAVLVDRSSEAIGIIQRNIGKCQLETQVKVVKQTISNQLNRLAALGMTFDLVFMDPPYDRQLVMPAMEGLRNGALLNTKATVVVEHGLGEPISDPIPGYLLTDRRRYGKTLVSFFKYGMDNMTKI